MMEGQGLKASTPPPATGGEVVTNVSFALYLVQKVLRWPWLKCLGRPGHTSLLERFPKWTFHASEAGEKMQNVGALWH